MSWLVGRCPCLTLTIVAGLVFASCGRPLGAWFDRDGNENEPGDAGGPGPRDAQVPPVDPHLRDPCKNMGGYDPEAPWPTWRRCPSRAALGKHAGPREPTIAWDVPCPFGLEGVAVDREGRIIGCGATSGTLAARSATDGAILWEAEPPEGAQIRGYPSLRADGLIIVPAMPGLAAFSAQGEAVWSVPMEIHGVQGSALLPDLDRIFGAVALNGIGTLMLYRFGPNGLVEQILSRDELHGDLGHSQLAMLSNGDPVVTIELPDLFLLSVGRLTRDGRVRIFLWDDPGRPGAMSVGSDDTIYLPSFANGEALTEVLGISPDGDITLRIPDFGSADQPPSIALDGDLVAVTSFDSGNLPTLRRHAPDGTLRFSLDLPSYSSGVVVVDAQGTAYVGVNDAVLAVDAEGRLLWTLALPGQYPFSLALGPPGRLYVQTLERLYAIGDASP